MSFAIQRNNIVSLVVASAVAAVTIGAIISKLVVVVRKNDKVKHMPIAPTGFHANIKGMTGKQGPFFLLDLARQMKRFSFRLRLPIPVWVYIIAEHELALEILKDAKTDKPPMQTFDVIVGSSNTFSSSNSAYWRFARKATAHAFSKNEISRMVQIATAKVQAWITKFDEIMDKDASFDPAFEMVKLTFEVICSAGFEYNSTDQEFNSFSHSLEISLREYVSKQGHMNPIRRVFGFLLSEVREAKRHCQSIQKFGAHVLQTYRENPNKSSNNTLIRLIAENPDFPSDKERIAEIITFMIGGHDTTGFTLASTLVLLAKHKSVAAKLRAELAQCRAEEWPNVEYFKCVVKESMRFMPVAAIGSVRTTGRDHMYRGEIVPKGSICMIPYLVVFRNEAVFEKPDEFIPERWLSPTDAMKDAFIPFAIGNRNCAGQALGKAAIDSVLPPLITSFDFELECEGEIDYFLTLKYAGSRLKAKRL